MSSFIHIAEAVGRADADALGVAEPSRWLWALWCPSWTRNPSGKCLRAWRSASMADPDKVGSLMATQRTWRWVSGGWAPTRSLWPRG
jgi:hypothetical protein